MCKFMQVSTSAYYEWLKRSPTAREKEEAELKGIIQEEFTKGRANYGARRIKKKLAERDRTVSRRRIGRIMRDTNLRCKTKRKFKATTDSRHNLPIAENLLNREFTVHKPDLTYVGDITYIHTLEGWLYLAVVIDLFSRKIVGWAMAEHMRAKLVNDALLIPLGHKWRFGKESQLKA